MLFHTRSHPHTNIQMRWLSMILLLIFFLFKFGWNQLKKIVIKWIFLITAKHTHLLTNRFQFYSICPLISLSCFLILSTLSGLWILFDHQNPIFDLYNLVKTNQIIHSKSHKMFMFCRFFRFIYLDDLTLKHTRSGKHIQHTSVWQNWSDRYRCCKGKTKTENHIKIK